MKDMSYPLTRNLGAIICLIWMAVSAAHGQSVGTEFSNGKWFDGNAFVDKTFYVVEGRLTEKRPGVVDKAVDLSGLWIVPPFGEGHNHNLATGVEEWDRKAIANYIRDGVFYVKIQGNLPITADEVKGLGVNDGRGPDVLFAQGSITAPGGHPIGLIENILLRQGYFPGYTKETLKDHRYFTVGSESELEAKWPAVLAKRPDFIKVLLWESEEHEERAANPAFAGQRALDPKLLPLIVSKAREAGLRVSAHVTTAADFHVAAIAGVDEINHLPFLGTETISEEDAKLVAKKKIVVVTTASLITRLPKNTLPDQDRPGVEKAQTANLKLLLENKVRLIIGSDNTGDTSIAEVEYLAKTGLFSNLALLKMWSETTPQTIFPGRKIGKLQEGYEASFLALEGDPIIDPGFLRKIRLRYKQGLLLKKH